MLAFTCPQDSLVSSGAHITSDICFVNYKRMKLGLRMHCSLCLWVCHEGILRISVRIVEFIGFSTLEIHHGFYSKMIHFNTAHLPLTNCWALTAYLSVQAAMGRVYPHLTGLTGCSNCLGLILPSPSTGKNYCTLFFSWTISLGNMWPLDGAYYSNYPERWMKLITSVLLVPLFFTMNFCCC